MAFIPVLQDQEDKESFAEIMSHPTRLDLTTQQIADKFNMSIGTIYIKLRDTEIAKLIKARRFERIKARLPEVDAVVIEKAIVKKDLKACELIYERWDDFVRRQGLEVSKAPELTPAESKARELRVKEYLDRMKGGDTQAKPMVEAETINITPQSTDVYKSLHNLIVLESKHELPPSPSYESPKPDSVSIEGVVIPIDPVQPPVTSIEPIDSTKPSSNE